MKTLQSFAQRFWEGCRRHYTLVLTVTTAVLVLQIFHLYWLFADVVLQKLVGRSFFLFPDSGLFVYAVIDYLEVPALVLTTALYLYELRQRFTIRNLWLLVMLNTQWAHLLWITDDVVVQGLGHPGLVTWPALAAWVAIGVDYLEVPVIVDRLGKFAETPALRAGVTLLPRLGLRLAYALTSVWR